MEQTKMKKTTRKLTRVSKYSFVLSIPKEIVEKYGWRERQKLVIEDKGRGKLEIRDWRSK
jgi:bifunctional DNA-binding transcriptional regulator/antitoxin component of YhaV-PrlF toxin-antitoxin module